MPRDDRVIADWMVRLGYRAAYWGARAWWFIRRPRTDGAAVAAWHGGRLLLIKTSYRNRYSLPGGFVKRHEGSRDAASRELLEETGILVPADNLALAWHGTLRVEHHDDTLTIWETELTDPPEIRANRRELVWVGWKTPEEARSLLLQSHVREYLTDRAGPAGRSRASPAI